MHERNSNDRKPILPDLPGNESYWAFLNQLSKMNTTLENEDVKKELEECERLWSLYSCDCLAFEMDWLKNKIYELSN